MRPAFKINGVDYSTSINKYSYSVSYLPIMGDNGGIMLDGSESVDLLAWKAQLDLVCNGLTATELSALLTACKQAYVSVTYFDVASNANRTAQFIPSIGSSKYRMSNRNGEMCFDGLTLYFRER